MIGKGDGGAEWRVLLLAPTRKDGEITRSLLASAGLQCVSCLDLFQSVSELEGERPR